VGTAKKLKKGKVNPSPLDPTVMMAWNKGYDAGAKEQRESDIKNLFDLLKDLEGIPGIGEKRAEKLREYFLEKFSQEVKS
jgi:hypothetical protein